MSADVATFSSHEDLTLSPSPSSTDVTPLPSPRPHAHLPDEIPSSPMSGLDDVTHVLVEQVTYEPSRKRVDRDSLTSETDDSSKRQRTEEVITAVPLDTISVAAPGNEAAQSVPDTSASLQPTAEQQEQPRQDTVQHYVSADANATDAASSLASIEFTAAQPATTAHHQINAQPATTDNDHTTVPASASTASADTIPLSCAFSSPAVDELTTLVSADSSSSAHPAASASFTLLPSATDSADTVAAHATHDAYNGHSIAEYIATEAHSHAPPASAVDAPAAATAATAASAHDAVSGYTDAEALQSAYTPSYPMTASATSDGAIAAEQIQTAHSSSAQGLEQYETSYQQPVAVSAAIDEQPSVAPSIYSAEYDSLSSPSPAGEQYQSERPFSSYPSSTSTLIDSEDEPDDESLLTTTEGDEEDEDEEDGYVARRRKRKSQSSRKSRSILCPACSSQHANEVDMYGHLAAAHNQHVCPNCQAAHTTADELKAHLNEHSRSRQHVCAFCGEGFTQSGHCKEHERIHTGEKPFVCPVPGCERGFSRNSYLKQHARIHTGEKRFVCSVDACGKGFRQSSTLKSHMRIHTGEKPYSCPLCPKMFRHGNTRKAHLVTEHPQSVAENPALLQLDDNCSVGSRTESSGDVSVPVAVEPAPVPAPAAAAPVVVVPQQVVTPQKPAAPAKTPNKRKTPARREPRSNAKGRRGDAMAQLTAAANGSSASSGGGSHPPHHNHSVLPDLMHPLPQHFPFPPFDMSKFEPPKPHDHSAPHSFPFSLPSLRLKTERMDGTTQPPRAHLPHFPFPFVPFPNTSGGTAFASPAIGSNGALPFPPIPLLPPPHLLPADHPLLALVARHGMPPADLPAHFFRLPPSRHAMRAAMNGASEAEVASEVRAEVDAEVEAATAAAVAGGVGASVSSLFTPAASFLSLQSSALGHMPTLSSGLFPTHVPSSPYPFHLPSPFIPSSSLLSAPSHLSSPTMLPAASMSASPPSLGLSLSGHFSSPSLLPSLMHSPSVPGLGMGGPLSVSLTDSPPFSTRLPPLHRGGRGGSGEVNGSRQGKTEAADVKVKVEGSDGESEEEGSELLEGIRRSKSIFQPLPSS